MVAKLVERKFKIDFNDGKKNIQETVSATTLNEAVRKVFPAAGQISLKPAESIVYAFEAELNEGGPIKVIKGEVKLARQTKGEE